ncbi:unnamed protein product [Echinostoma caproni]|uniref:SUN domain-containing protein n=1 Tax=Echinostoma caproni TaxID=27848 RepID=A0A183AHA9_9TREM|nr:unnamed protein product [Echinostoma caproni]
MHAGVQPLKSRVQCVLVPSLPKVIFHGPTDGKLMEQLMAFSETVNQRLEVLSENLRSTNARVFDMATKTTLNSNSLKDQMSEFKEQLNNYSTALKQWQLEWQAHQASSSVPQTNEVESVSETSMETLLHSAINLMNQTVLMHIESLQIELRADESGRWKQYEERLSKLTLLLANLRFQLTYRIRQTEHQLNQLRLELRKNLDRESTVGGELLSLVNDLRTTITKLEEKHLYLQKAVVETDSIARNSRDVIRECNQRLLHSCNGCRQLVAEQVSFGIANLSDQLTIQITSLVEKALLKQIQTEKFDSKWFTHLNNVVGQIARESVEEALNTRIYVDDNTDNSMMNLSDIRTIQKLIDTALLRFAADRTGLADFALESSGGAIVGTRCTRTYTEGSSLFSLFGIPTILQPGNNPGDCWPFHGSTGQAVIRLSAPVIISAVSLEHLPRSLAPNQRLDSAPKDFVIKNQTEPVQYVEFTVLSNHGHPVYTCVYRLRVHGTMAE